MTAEQFFEDRYGVKADSTGIMGMRAALDFADAHAAEKEREIASLVAEVGEEIMRGDINFGEAEKYMVRAEAAEQRLQEAQAALEDKRTLARQLDVIWNGEKGAAKQASLCDIVSQIERELPRLRQREAASMSEIEKTQDGERHSEGSESDHSSQYHDSLKDQTCKESVRPVHPEGPSQSDEASRLIKRYDFEDEARKRGWPLGRIGRWEVWQAAGELYGKG